jgi:Protein  of unknown function (DUF3018)
MPQERSNLLTLRAGADTARSPACEVRRRLTKGEVARAILEAGLGGGPSGRDLLQEAQRQSLLVREGRSERDILGFLDEAADTRGWR